MFVISESHHEVAVTINLAIHAILMKEFSSSSFCAISDKVNLTRKPTVSCSVGQGGVGHLF